MSTGSPMWQHQDNNHQALQNDYRKTSQSEDSPLLSNFSGLSVPHSQHQVQPILHDLLQYNRPKAKDQPRSEWVAEAIEELEHLDEEIVEEALPEINADTKKKAERIIRALPKHPIAPVIYPTVDGEVAIYFKSPDAPSSALILVGNDGQAACFSCIGGKNRRARYGDSSELPDEFVKEQLRELKKRPLSKNEQAEIE